LARLRALPPASPLSLWVSPERPFGRARPAVRLPLPVHCRSLAPAVSALPPPPPSAIPHREGETGVHMAAAGPLDQAPGVAPALTPGAPGNVRGQRHAQQKARAGGTQGRTPHAPWRRGGGRRLGAHLCFLVPFPGPFFARCALRCSVLAVRLSRVASTAFARTIPFYCRATSCATRYCIVEPMLSSSPVRPLPARPACFS
jgi:hypothetical protein